MKEGPWHDAPMMVAGSASGHRFTVASRDEEESMLEARQSLLGADW